MERTPQSTARRYLMKAFLTADGEPATGKTIPVVISKNGGALANPSAGATNLTEIASGWYFVDLSVADHDTQGPLLIRGTEADIDDTERILEVSDPFNNGFTGVPAAAADAAGGLPISDAGGLDLDTQFGAIVAAVAASAIRTALGLTSANLDSQLGDLPTNAELTSALAAYAAGQPTESYAADGSVPTRDQFLFMILQSLGEFSISGTSLTTRKLDKATTAMVHTLDDATSPTSRTRSS